MLPWNKRIEVWQRVDTNGSTATTYLRSAAVGPSPRPADRELLGALAVAGSVRAGEGSTSENPTLVVGSKGDPKKSFAVVTNVRAEVLVVRGNGIPFPANKKELAALGAALAAWQPGWGDKRASQTRDALLRHVDSQPGDASVTRDDPARFENLDAGALARAALPYQGSLRVTMPQPLGEVVLSAPGTPVNGARPGSGNVIMTIVRNVAQESANGPRELTSAERDALRGALKQMLSQLETKFFPSSDADRLVMNLKDNVAAFLKAIS